MIARQAAPAAVSQPPPAVAVEELKVYLSDGSSTAGGADSPARAHPLSDPGSDTESEADSDDSSLDGFAEYARRRQGLGGAELGAGGDAAAAAGAHHDPDKLP